MTRLSLCALGLGLFAAPVASAQTPTPQQTMQTQNTPMQQRPMTATDIQRERAAINQRVDRLDRDFRDYERSIANVRDADARARMQQDVTRMREANQSLRRDAGAFATLQGDEFMTRQRDFDTRYGEADAMLYEARLRSAQTPAEFRRLTDARFQMQSEMMGQNALANVPQERRAESAYEMIRMRNRQDQLRARSFGTTRAQQERFARERDAYTRDLLSFERDRRTMSDRMMHGGMMHDGMQMNRQGQQPMQQGQQPMQQGQQPMQQGQQPTPPAQQGQTPPPAQGQQPMTDQQGRTTQQGQTGTQPQPQGRPPQDS